MTAHLASSTLYPMHDSIVAEAKKVANKMILKPQTSTPLKIPTNFLANQGEQMVKQEAKDGQKSTRFLSNRAVSLLNKWFIENRDYPYPDEQTTDYLAREAEISVKQVKKWFANKRVRSQLCCKPIHRNRKSKNSSQLNESIKYSRQLEVAENRQTNESNYPFLRLPIQQHYQQQQQQQRQQSIQQFPPSSLLQPAIGFAHSVSCQMPVQPSLSLMRPLDSCVPNSAASPLYGQLMLMNLIATQRHAQMQSLNLLSKLSNQSSSTTSASISSAVSNSSANSNEDYLNDLQEEDEGESKEENDEREDEEEEEEEIVDVDESNDYRQNGNKHNDQNQNFYSMLMMINPNYIKREQNQDNDDHISAISPPPSGTSMYTTSSSSVPYISSSSSSCSSSSNSSKNTTPNTDSNKYYAAGMYTEKDHFLSNDESSEQEQKDKKATGEKKINFAIISTLVD